MYKLRAGLAESAGVRGRDPSPLIPHCSSLLFQHGHRVDTGGTAGGQVARECGNDEQ